MHINSTSQQHQIERDLVCHVKFLPCFCLGVEHVRDLADQEASLYDHVVTLLSEHDSVRKRFKTNDVSTIKIREAANIARSTIHSYISSIDRREDFCRTEILMENLVNAELMCPAREFLQVCSRNHLNR